jgi:hypothetical protein
MIVVNSLYGCPLLPDSWGFWGELSSFLHSSQLLTKLIVNLSILIEILLFPLHSLSFDLNLCRLLLLLYPTHLLLHQIQLLYLIEFLKLVVVHIDRGRQLYALALTFERALFGGEKACFLVLFVDCVIVYNSDCVLMEFASLGFLDVVAKTVQLLVPFPIEVIARLFIRRFATSLLAVKWGPRLI